MDEPVAATIDRQVRRKAGIVRGALLVAAAWMILYLGLCLDQALSWSEPVKGLMNGAMVGWLLAAFGLLPALALGLVCVGIVHLTPWRRHRRWFLLLPAAVVLLSVPLARLRERIDPGIRFERMTGAPLPASVRNLRTEFSGGLFADFTEVYSFECPPADTVALIRALGLRRQADAATHIVGGPGGGFSAAAVGWTDPEVWSGEPGHAYFCELHTDATRTKVHIVLGTI